MTEWQKEERIMMFVVIGLVLFIITAIAYALWVDWATPTVTPAGPNCVIIQKALQKEVRCFTNVDVNTEKR